MCFKSSKKYILNGNLFIGNVKRHLDTCNIQVLDLNVDHLATDESEWLLYEL